MEQSRNVARLIQSEASVGDVRVEYCAAPRSVGDWFAVGTVIQRDGAPDRSTPVVSGLGATERLAVERMLRGVAERMELAATAGSSGYPESFAIVGRTPAT